MAAAATDWLADGNSMNMLIPEKFIRVGRGGDDLTAVCGRVGTKKKKKGVGRRCEKEPKNTYRPAGPGKARERYRRCGFSRH